MNRGSHVVLMCLDVYILHVYIKYDRTNSCLFILYTCIADVSTSMLLIIGIHALLFDNTHHLRKYIHCSTIRITRREQDFTQT